MDHGFHGYVTNNQWVIRMSWNKHHLPVKNDTFHETSYNPSGLTSWQTPGTADCADFSPAINAKNSALNRARKRATTSKKTTYHHINGNFRILKWRYVRLYTLVPYFGPYFQGIFPLIIRNRQGTERFLSPCWYLKYAGLTAGAQ